MWVMKYSPSSYQVKRLGARGFVWAAVVKEGAAVTLNRTALRGQTRSTRCSPVSAGLLMPASLTTPRAPTCLHRGTHSSSLCRCDSTMVAAVVSLTGRWGGGDVCLGRLAGARVLASRAGSPWVSSFGGSKVKRPVAKRGRESGDGAFSRRLARGSTSVVADSSSLIKPAHRLKKRKEKEYK